MVRWAATFALGIVGSVTSASVVFAQGALGVAANGSAEREGGWKRDQCLGGVTYGAPLKLAVSWAGGLRKELTNGQNVCAFVAPKVGLGGARLAVGLARTMGTLGTAVAVSGGLLRTFGAPSHADRMSTYAGASLHLFPLLAVGLELGLYKKLGHGTASDRQSIVVWSGGFGF